MEALLNGRATKPAVRAISIPATKKEVPMSFKPLFVALSLLVGTACFAAAESNSEKTVDISKSQPSSQKGDTASPQEGTAVDPKEPKKPDMAEYCREQTC